MLASGKKRRKGCKKTQV